jgi:RNA polymerase sigma-70 factor (ECF subfamily)
VSAWRDVIPDDTAVGSFTELVKDLEPRLRHALSTTYGLDVGREATAEALAYGWEHWEQLRMMENPAGYLYKVGRTKARRLGRKPAALPPVDSQRWPWVEPALPDALQSLSEKQRTVVVLLHSFGWTYAEVAELLQIARGSVQRHEERALRKLRAGLGVIQDA